MILLDGPLGTELDARGIATPPPLWSAAAITEAPDVIQDIHRDYALAGATLHTTNTFRTRPRQAGPTWATLATRAVALARAAIPPHHRVAGSIAPLEDCYRPDLSPANPAPEHRALAQVLAAASVDILLCETFPHVGEALAAVAEAVATGLPVWVSFTAGPDADLLTPTQVGHAAREAVARGASAVLVNCIPASRTLLYIEQLAGAGVPFGAYANAGACDEGMGWERARTSPRASATSRTPPPADVTSRAALAYAAHARTWLAAGATLVGGCCGTGPAHIAALAALDIR